MENEIKRVQNLMESPNELTEAEQEEINTMVLRFARHLRSPSKLNAVSVLKSNSAEKLAAWLSQEEGLNAC